MSAKKAMYMITDGLYPHCKQSLMKDIDQVYFVLEYNKTTNSERKKLQIRVHFWPFLRDQVGSCHLVMYFMEYATGEKIVKKADVIHLEQEFTSWKINLRKAAMVIISINLFKGNRKRNNQYFMPPQRLFGL